MSSGRPQNLVEKIAQRYAYDLSPGQVVCAGDFLSIKPAHVMTHDNTGAVIPKFKAIGATAMADPRQPVYTLDHNVQDQGEKNLAKYAAIEAFAAEMGVDFYPAGRGIGHQIMCEEGYAWPGSMVVASDSHSNTYGGLGCLGTPIVRTDAAAIWATGRTWWQVPPVARVTLTGALRSGATGKDVIITLAGLFNEDQVLNHAIEFAGAGLASLGIEARLTVANMTTEWGALVGLFPVDEAVLAWTRARVAMIELRGLEGKPSDADGGGAHPRVNAASVEALIADPLAADVDAVYAKEITLDLSTVQPHLAGPHNVKTMTPVAAFSERELPIHKAYLLSCTNGRVEDLAEAAAVVKGNSVAEGVEFYVAAASSNVQAEAERRGDWQALMEAGARMLPPGCGPCIGLGTGLLEAGEVGISATNRNFKGRMGSPEAEAYLASPAVVAASALAGRVTLPEDWCFDAGQMPVGEVGESMAGGSAAAAVEILDGFPVAIEGELLFCHTDNMNTDGIYPGKYTYQDDITPEQQAEVAMENYDPAFQKLAEKGDLLVGGFNFGSGSSREQAATALKYRGIALVLAGSLSETYKRNALNNGFLVLEAPELSRDLKARFGEEALTQRTGMHAKLDFSAATLDVEGKVYVLSPVGAAAQELVLAGGLESWVKERL